MSLEEPQHELNDIASRGAFTKNLDNPNFLGNHFVNALSSRGEKMG